MFSAAGLIGMLAISVASIWAAERAGETEAMTDVKAVTQVVAKTVVEPNLSEELLEGDPLAIARLDSIVHDRVLDSTTMRVKLWDGSGRIVYSDEPRLIGEIHELDEGHQKSLRSGTVVSEISSLDGPENRFETQAKQMLEVYLPIQGPQGEPLLYESYFAPAEVANSTRRIRSEFLPITFAALGLMETMHLGLAWGLNRRMSRNQKERELLLQRAISSSDTERRRVAADLHDGVVQELVATSFTVAAAAESVDNPSPRLAADLRAAAVGTRRSLQSLRSLLVDIYPPNLQEQGLESALIDLLAPGASLGIETSLAFEGDPQDKPEAVKLVYRILQESVRNVLRHADATELSVEVEATEQSLTGRVTDNGKGLTADVVFRVGDRVRGPEGHLGLRLLSDLAADAGARFDVTSIPGEGTTIEIEVSHDHRASG